MINPDFNLGLLAGHNIWQSVIIFSIVFAILKIIKKTSAEERSWSWSATLFALALLPMAAFLPGEGIKLQNEAPNYVAKNIETAVAVAPAEINLKNKTKSQISVAVEKPVISKDALLSTALLVWFCGIGVSFMRLILAGYNAASLRKSAYPYAPVDQEFNRNWPDSVEIAISPRIGILKPTVLIPRGFAYEMNSEELNPLLFHELAHIKRRDNILHLIERVILGIYWWNPVMHFIATQISEERELACDDRAAKSCGDHIVYAKSLLKGARQIVGQNKPILGLAVLRRESPLSKRVKRLTATTVFSGLNLKRLSKNLSLVFISVLCLGLITPRFAVGQVEINRDGHSSVEATIDDLILEVEWQGNLVLNEEETNFIAMDDDGYLSLETEQDGVVRKLILKGSGGEINREFFINGTANDFDEAEYAWQTENLKRMLRLSAINAEKRVDHIYAKGGVDAVLDEIDQLLSDYAVRLYTESLVDVYELDQPQITRLLTTLDKMESGYEKGLALAAIADEQDLDVDTGRMVAQAIDENGHREFISEDMVLALADIDTEAGVLALELEVDEKLELELSEQEIESIREQVEIELDNLPTEGELAEIIEKAHADLPTEAELAEILADAQAEMPTQEELEEIIRQSTELMLSADERARIVEEAIAEMPTQEELTRIVEEAMAEVPTEEEIERMVVEAKASMPTKEELERIIEEARAGMPSREEIDQMREDMRRELQELKVRRQELKKSREELKESQEGFQ